MILGGFVGVSGLFARTGGPTPSRLSKSLVQLVQVLTVGLHLKLSAQLWKFQSSKKQFELSAD